MFSRFFLVVVLSILGTGIASADPCNAPLPPAHSQFGGTVDYIIDGDGLCLGGIEVRLGDFNAPELNEPGGREAKAALQSIALGKHADCIACLGARGRCRSYDRIIATCAIGGRAIGDLLRELGIVEGGR